MAGNVYVSQERVARNVSLGEALEIYRVLIDAGRTGVCVLQGDEGYHVWVDEVKA